MKPPVGQLEQLLENQKEIMRGLHDVALDRRLTQAWYLTSECAALKGVSHSYLTDNRWAQPMGGERKERVAGRMRWTRAAVKEWLDQTDEVLLRLYGSAKDKVRARATIARETAFAGSREAS